MSEGLKGYNEVLSLWQRKGSTEQAGIELTLSQAEALERIVDDDNKWKKLIEIFRRGRAYDPWLAVDWPEGFDELVLCAPLCKYVEWECARCYVGKRQKNFSCANEDSLFGYIAVLLSLENRDLIKEHIQNIKNLLSNPELNWDIEKHVLSVQQLEVK
ncbi:MAG TPA: hypothetical protein VGK25_04245 [Ignavibacteria bacterium]